MIAVEIENFQSIESLKFTIDGFTAIVGDSDLGKSAIVRALKCALTGAAGTDFVRHGAACERRLKNTKKCRCKTSVRISSPKLSFRWEKGDSINKYTVFMEDGQEDVFDRVGSGAPDFLLPFFNPIKIGEASQVLIQVADQFRMNGAGGPIFLLDVSGPSVAEVLSDVARLDALNEAMKLVQKDRKDDASTRNVRERDLVQLQTELEGYAGLDAAIARVRGVETRQAELENARAHYQKVSEHVRTLDSLAIAIRALNKVLGHKLPDEDALLVKQTRFLEVDKLFAEVLQRTPDVKRLTGIEKVQLPEETTADVSSAFDTLQQLDTFWRQEEALRQDIEKGEKASALKLAEFSSVSEVQDRFEALQDFTERETTLHAEVTTLETSIVDAQKEEASALAELKALGLCPTCAGPIGAETHLHFDEAP